MYRLFYIGLSKNIQKDMCVSNCAVLCSCAREYTYVYVLPVGVVSSMDIMFVGIVLVYCLGSVYRVRPNKIHYIIEYIDLIKNQILYKNLI